MCSSQIVRELVCDNWPNVDVDVDVDVGIGEGDFDGISTGELLGRRSSFSALPPIKSSLKLLDIPLDSSVPFGSSVPLCSNDGSSVPLGSSVSPREGLSDGSSLIEGLSDGTMKVGLLLGCSLGLSDGEMLRCLEGAELGVPLGTLL